MFLSYSMSMLLLLLFTLCAAAQIFEVSDYSSEILDMSGLTGDLLDVPTLEGLKPMAWYEDETTAYWGTDP